MNRQERERFEYGSYDDYNNDAHYHGARNLTNEFERNYRRDHGNANYDRYQPVRSYHEGSDIEDTNYNRNRNRNTYADNRYRSENMRHDRDNDRNIFGYYNDNQDNYRGDSGMYRDWDSENRNRDNDYNGDYNAYNRQTSFGVRDEDTDYSYRNRDYSDRPSQAVRYIPDEGRNYSSNRNQFRDDRWYNSDERNRYY